MCPDLSSEEDLRGSFRKAVSDQQQQQQQIYENWKITNYITFPPANSLRTNRGGGSWKHITNKIYV